MKAIGYYRVSNQEQETLSLKQQRKQVVDYANENGLSFIVCSSCNGEWIVNTLSKENLRNRKYYPKPKCPTCD